MRRVFLKTMLAGLCTSTLRIGETHAAAVRFPTKPIRIIVPVSPGTTPDTVGRLLGELLGSRLRQPVIVENKTGAGGKIGVEAAARSAADGYTLLMGGRDWQGVFPHLYPTWDIDPVKAFAPISLVTEVPILISANLGLPVTGLQDLIRLAKSKPGLRYGTPGVGTIVHLTAEMLSEQQGLGLQHIPFRNQSDMISAVVRGDIELVFSGVPPLLPFVKSGRLKAVATTGRERSKSTAAIPTILEQGLPGFEDGAWFGLLAPSGTPDEVIRILNENIVEVARSAPFVERIQGMDAEVKTTTPEEMDALIKSDVQRLGVVFKNAKIQPL